MDIKKIKENSVKILILFLNLLLVMGGVFYFKNKDQQKKEAKILEEQTYNEEVAKYETEQIQQALEESNIQKEESIAGNPDTITKQEAVVVKKTIPAVTKEVTTKKPSKSTSSS